MCTQSPEEDQKCQGKEQYPFPNELRSSGKGRIKKTKARGKCAGRSVPAPQCTLAFLEDGRVDGGDRACLGFLGGPYFLYADKVYFKHEKEDELC